MWAKQVGNTSHNANQADQTIEGRLFDCKDSMQSRIDGNFVRSVVVTRNSASSSSSSSSDSQQLGFSALDANVFGNNINQLQQWNSYALSFKDGKMRYHFNSVQVAESSLSFSILNTNSEYCVIGNSLSLQDPFNGYLRHLVFSREGFNSGQDITNKVRAMVLPTDSNVLAYFRFDKYFQYSETYFQNVSRDYSHQYVSIGSSQEAENVCYCTNSGLNLLKVSSAFTLRPLPLTTPAGGIDQGTITFGAQIYPISYTRLANSSGDGSVVLISITNFFDLIATSDGLYSGRLYNSQLNNAQTFTFTKSRIRFSTWSSVKITINSNTVALTIDDVVQQSLNHGVQGGLSSIAGQSLQINSQSQFTYLLRIAQVNDTRSQVLFNQIFAETALKNQFAANFVAQGTLEYDINNRFCAQDKIDSNLWVAPIGCADNREYPLFNKGTPKTIMIEDLTTSRQTLTMEMWIKDNKTITDNDTQVLLQAMTNNFIYTQWSLNSYNNAQNVREVTIHTNYSGDMNQNISIRIGRSNNTWMHVYILSSVPTGMTLGVYNSSTMSGIIMKNSSMTFQEVPTLLTTAIGSTILGTNRFNGFMREFRIWNTARTVSEIQLYRFQTPKTDAPSLIHYFQMNMALYSFSIPDSRLGATDVLAPNDMTATTPNYKWVADNDGNLVICPQGQYFNGQCCNQIDLTIFEIGYSFDYATMQHNLQVQPAGGAPMSANYRNSLFGDWEMISVGYDYDGRQYDALNPIFEQAAVRNFSVSGFVVDPKIYSITLKVRFYTLFDATRDMTITKTIIIPCPLVYMVLNNNVFTTNQQVVSGNSYQFTRFTMLALNKQLDCYNPQSKMIETQTITSAQWSHSLTNTDFNFMWVTQNNGNSIQMKPVAMVNTTTNTLTAQFRFSNGQVIQDSMTIQYQLIPIANPNFPNVALGFVPQRHHAMDSDLVFNISGSTAKDSRYTNASFNLLAMCPTSLVPTVQGQAQLCTVNQTTGLLRLPSDTLRTLPIKFGTPYVFTLLMGIQNTTITRMQNITVYFYNPPTDIDAPCPNLNFMPEYAFDKVNDKNFEITPQSTLACEANGVFYMLNTSSWRAYHSENSSLTYQYAASMDSVNYPLSVFLYRINYYVHIIPSGTWIGLQGNYTFKAVSSDGTPVNDTMISQQFNIPVYMKNMALVPLVVVYNPVDGQNLTDNTMRFLDQQMNFNGQGSYDPDNSQATLTFKWLCPVEIINDAQCQQMQNGQANKALFTIDAVTRQTLPIVYNSQYTFTLVIETADKDPVNLSFIIKFAGPTKDNQGVNSGATTCETLQFLSNPVLYQDASGRVVLPYNKYNFFDRNFTYKATNDGSSGTTNCNNGKVVEQYLYMQFFDGINMQMANLQPMSSYSQANSNSVAAYKQSQTFSFLLYDNTYVLTNLDANNNKYYQISLFMFTRRANGKISINRLNVFLNFQRIPLVPVFPQNYMKVDFYEDLVLDITDSLNLTDSDNTGLTYKWLCPGRLPSCEKATGSKVVINFQERTDHMYNIVNYNFTFVAMVTDGVSRQANATITVYFQYAKDYTNCLIPWLVSSPAYLGQDISSHANTYYFEYLQDTSFVFSIDEINSCAQMKIGTPMWYNLNATSNVTFYKPMIGDIYSVEYNAQTVKAMSTDVPYTLVYSNTFYMGIDSERVYNKTTTLSVARRRPDVVANIEGPLVFTYGKGGNMTLDGSDSFDSMKNTLSYVWDCPNFKGCSTSSFLIVNDTLINRITNNNVPAYAEKSYTITLTVTSADGRKGTFNYYMYLTLGTTGPMRIQDMNTCQVTKSDGSQVVNLDESNVFQLQCKDQETTMNIIHQSGYQFQWRVLGLDSSAYHTLNDILILPPYVLSDLGSAKSVIITIDFLQTNYTVVPDSRDYTSYQVFTVGFPLARSLLVSGYNVAVSSQDIKAYSDSVSIMFNKIASTKSTTILAQVRGEQTLYDFTQIIVPLKPINAAVIQSFYTNMTLPYLFGLTADFFDVKANYLGSWDLSNVKMSQGLLFQNEFEKELSEITSKSASEYGQNDQDGIDQFEKDLARLLQLIEMLNNKLIVGEITKMTPGYCQDTANYLKDTLSYGIFTYNSNPSSAWEGNQQFTIMRRVTQIIFNIMQVKIKFDRFIIPMSQAFVQTQPMVGYMLSTQDDFDGVRNLVQGVVGGLTYYLQLSAQPEKGDLLNKLRDYKDSIARINLLNTLTNQTNSTIIGENSVSVAYRIPKDAPAIRVASSYDPDMWVETPPTKKLAGQAVQFINVLFDKERNATSAVTDTIRINAFDNNLNVIEVNFESDYQNSNFKMAFKTDPGFLELHRASNFEKYELKCVYYDYNLGDWSEQGMATENFDNDTGVVDCHSIHLSTFSVVYIEKSPTIRYGFYEQYDGYYAFSIVFGLFVVVALLLLAMYCKARTKYEVIYRVKGVRTCSQMVWPVFKAYNPVVKAFFEMRDRRMQLPLFIHVLALFIYVFSIIMFTCIDALYVGEGYKYDGLRALYFTIVYGVILTLIRPFLNWLLYVMFFYKTKGDSKIEENEKQYRHDTEESIKLKEGITTPRGHAKGVKSKSMNEDDMLNHQYEGGDDEESKEDPIVIVNNRNAGMPTKKSKTAKNDTSSEDSSSYQASEIEPEGPSMFRSMTVKKIEDDKKKAQGKKGKKVRDSSSSDSDDEKHGKHLAATAAQKQENDSDSSSEQESSYQASEIVHEGPSKMRTIKDQSMQQQQTYKPTVQQQKTEQPIDKIPTSSLKPVQSEIKSKSSSSFGSDTSYAQSDIAPEINDRSMKMPTYAQHQLNVLDQNEGFNQLVHDLRQAGPDEVADPIDTNTVQISLFKPDPTPAHLVKKANDIDIQPVEEESPDSKRGMLKKDLSISYDEEEEMRNNLYLQIKPKMNACRWLIVIFQTLVLACEIIVTYILMRNLPIMLLMSWIYSFITIIAFFFAYDVVACLFFTIVYWACTNKESGWVHFFSYLFGQNPALAARQMLALEVRDI